MTDADAGPAELIAVTEYVVESSATVGVPEITQVEVLIFSPEGSAEATEQVMSAPFALKMMGATDIATPTVPEVPVAPA